MAKSSKSTTENKTEQEVESTMTRDEAQAIVNKYNTLGKDAGEPAELVEARKVLEQS